MRRVGNHDISHDTETGCEREQELPCCVAKATLPLIGKRILLASEESEDEEYHANDPERNQHYICHSPREAARGYMPANLETKIVVTGNYRAWRHFLAMRANEHADAEIRGLALEIFKHLMEEAPNIFDDFVYVEGEGLEIVGLRSDYMEIS